MSRCVVDYIPICKEGLFGSAYTEPVIFQEMKKPNTMGYSRKYPHTPMDDTELGPQKFQDFHEEQQQFLQDSKACCFTILMNSRILQDFEWFSWNSGQNSQNFVEIHGFPMSSMGVCGYFLE